MGAAMLFYLAIVVFIAIACLPIFYLVKQLNGRSIGECYLDLFLIALGGFLLIFVALPLVDWIGSGFGLLFENVFGL